MENPQPATAEAVVLLPSALTTASENSGLVQARAEAYLAPPPGTETFILPGVGRVIGYPDRRADTAPGPAREPTKPVPRWVLSAAILMPSASGSLALLTLAAPGLTALTGTLLAFVAATGTLALAGIGTVVLVRLLRPGRTGPQEVTATATATSRSLLGGKATATATATAKR